MSLIINQGKQDTSGDSNFDIIVSANETAQIIKIELNKDKANTLNLTFKIISEGAYKNRQFWDNICFDPKSNLAWKYRNVRKAAGCPYVDGESPKIDIEALLLNKAVTVELGERTGTDGNKYQQVKYKVVNTEKPAPAKATEEEPKEEITEDELPFIDPDTDTDVEW